ncbi:MAG: hypothetical protein GX446_14725 [Chthonomonadales bacterium]|nr:hypothetical protein [Chthonomonadales bacterium]
MRKWKYRTMVLRDLSIAESKLNAEGEKGWELVSMCLMDSNTARAFFKAPIEEDQQQAAIATETGLEGHSPF